MNKPKVTWKEKTIGATAVMLLTTFVVSFVIAFAYEVMCGLLFSLALISADAPPGDREILRVFLLTLPIGAIAGLYVLLWCRNALLQGPTQCVECGYDLRGTPKNCPECGDELDHW